MTAGSKVTLTDIGDISLAGVLRSELQAHMEAQLAKYMKDARVRATPLVSLSVLGPVGRPGFYFMPPDIPLTDAVMRAGGPGSQADLGALRDQARHGRVVRFSQYADCALPGADPRSALAPLRRQIVVGRRDHTELGKVASVISVVTSLVFALSYGLSRR